jgi:hypothetical protein
MGRDDEPEDVRVKSKGVAVVIAPRPSTEEAEGGCASACA